MHHISIYHWYYSKPINKIYVLKSYTEDIWISVILRLFVWKTILHTYLIEYLSTNHFKVRVNYFQANIAEIYNILRNLLKFVQKCYAAQLKNKKGLQKSEQLVRNMNIDWSCMIATTYHANHVINITLYTLSLINPVRHFAAIYSSQTIVHVGPQKHLCQSLSLPTVIENNCFKCTPLRGFNFTGVHSFW